jgi:glutamyl-tRNA synthetase
MSLTQLAEKFDTPHLSKSPAKFDEAQLLYWQKETLSRIPAEELWQAMGSEVHALVPSAKKEEFIKTIRHNIHFPKDARIWAEVLYGNYTPVKSDISVDFLKKVVIVLQENNQVEGLLERIKIATGEKGKGLFHPIRVVLTGRSDGPELAALFYLLGSEEMTSRFQKALHVHL